ncbi:MAG TPA: tetratricopeptide repeat protein [Candidatus Acidoferrum sp.]
MKREGRNIMMAVAMLAALLFAKTTLAQTASTGQAAPAQEKGQAAAPAAQEPAPAPVNAEEDAAMKAFRETPNTELEKKEQLAEAFLEKHPQSRYRSELYSWLVQAYYAAGKTDQMEAAGDKELELNPNDVQTLASVGSSLPRATHPGAADAAKRWEKAERYCKKALELLPTLVRPENMDDAVFARAKSQTSAMAYSGLGVAAFRQGKYTEAISNLEQAVRTDPIQDPVNFYVLGVSDQQSAHYDDAVAAFNKCAALPGGLQTTCKTAADEAKKLAATRLSAPK